MKINITLNSRERLPGFTTIDPFFDGKHHEGVVAADIYNFDRYCSDGEADEIRAIDVLGYFSPALVDNIFAYWCKKVAYGGVVTIGGIEPYLLSKLLVTRAISITDYNEIIYGKHAYPWDFRKSVVDLSTLERSLKQKNLVVIHKDIVDSYKYIIKAKKVLDPNAAEV